MPTVAKVAYANVLLAYFCAIRPPICAFCKRLAFLRVLWLWHFYFQNAAVF